MNNKDKQQVRNEENHATLDLKELEEKSKDTFWGYLGCKIASADEHHVKLKLEVKPHHYNVMGIVHGGVLSTLMDNCMGIAGMMARPGMKVVTTNLNLHFLAQATSDILWTTARIVHETGRTLTLEAKVTDEEGSLFAMGTATFRAIPG